MFRILIKDSKHMLKHKTICGVLTEKLMTLFYLRIDWICIPGFKERSLKFYG
jgi:hypothetical protein